MSMVFCSNSKCPIYDVNTLCKFWGPCEGCMHKKFSNKEADTIVDCKMKTVCIEIYGTIFRSEPMDDDLAETLVKRAKAKYTNINIDIRGVYGEPDKIAKEDISHVDYAKAMGHHTEEG